MDRWLQSLSRNTIAVGAIAIGTLVIILMDPPKTVCDAQIEAFKESQKGFLFEDPNDKEKQQTDFAYLLDYCKRANTTGGCYELFMKLKVLEQDIRRTPIECLEEVGALAEVKQAVWSGLDLLVRIAWGGEAPTTQYDKLGWLDSSDLYLYCNYTRLASDLYGEATFASFREQYFTQLPGADKIARKDAWPRMLFSVNCDRYR